MELVIRSFISSGIGIGQCCSPAASPAARTAGTWSSVPRTAPTLSPNASCMWPVRVAMSMTTSGSSSTASDSASPSSIRPSASVLAISTVDPLCIVMTSPGRVEVAETMFSAIGAKVVTLTGSPRRAIASVAATTLAAPAMSPFMLTMLDEGLIVRPPESKVTPLPTSARCATASLGAQVSFTSREGDAEELPTLRMPPQPISSSCSWSKTSSFTFGAPRPLVTALWALVTRSASSGGVQSIGGVLTQSRVSATASARISAFSSAATASARRAIVVRTTTSEGSVVSAFADL